MDSPAAMATPLPGRMIVALARNAGVRLLSVSVPGPATELADRHRLGPVARTRAAEGLVATALLSAHIKGEERLTFDLQATSPPCAAVFEINGDGTLRGRFRPADLPDSASLAGLLSVSKSLGRTELYRGVAEVRNESVEAALQRYLHKSQQADSRVRLAALLGEDGAVEYADGLLMERMPHFPPEEFEELVKTILGDPRRLFDELALGLFGGESVELVGDAQLRFSCGCSREKVVQMLRSLGAAEIDGILTDLGSAEVTCHFCNEVYRVEGPELLLIRDSLNQPEA